ncbi:antirestriction protein ArdA [Ponticaulis koreensis]|uniref:antirestriction protein ArdA n=1 Tax=Ponticaulis koreensis TaxID=1123045 RepID=UPI0003B7815D|nr:antirestriction protein ArdA [Ponticaulis koreensis]
MKNEGEIRIYVACLAAYSNGYLHGQWIDVTLGEDAIWDQINEVLKTSPMPDAEEWAIHDSEGFEGLNISEYEGIQSVVEQAEFIEEHGRLGAELVTYYGDLETARKALEDDYAGVYKSLTEFAEELTEQTTPIPDSLQYYIDYERMARDLAVNDVLAVELGFEEIHVFWSR